MPVTLPPGRAKLAIKPPFTGSPLTAITMGILRVAFLAANGAVFPPSVMITSTLS